MKGYLRQRAVDGQLGSRMVEAPKGKLAGEPKEGHGFPLRANLMDNLERAERSMFQGGRDHGSEATDDHQGGSQPVGSSGRQKLKEFSVGRVACYPPRSSM